mmetsp:Transcript_32792/g.110493  ORF Transcript_32792/g.110493 Transcript_32792/m.110493 type:complete len:231 (+) Transcript_32792:2371-3063(+)
MSRPTAAAAPSRSVGAVAGAAASSLSVAGTAAGFTQSEAQSIRDASTKRSTRASALDSFHRTSPGRRSGAGHTCACSVCRRASTASFAAFVARPRPHVSAVEINAGNWPTTTSRTTLSISSRPNSSAPPLSATGNSAAPYFAASRRRRVTFAARSAPAPQTSAVSTCRKSPIWSWEAPAWDTATCASATSFGSISKSLATKFSTNAVGPASGASTTTPRRADALSAAADA